MNRTNGPRPDEYGPRIASRVGLYDRFHMPGDYCPWGKWIEAKNLIEFEDRREAIEAGYKPCMTCRA